MRRDKQLLPRFSSVPLCSLTLALLGAGLLAYAAVGEAGERVPAGVAEEALLVPAGFIAAAEAREAPDFHEIPEVTAPVEDLTLSMQPVKAVTPGLDTLNALGFMPRDAANGSDEISPASADPGSVVMLMATSVPKANREVIARTMGRLGIPLVLSGLPVLVRTPEARAKAIRENRPMESGPFMLDKKAWAAITQTAARTRSNWTVSSEVWHAVRDRMDREPPVPALVIFGERTVEVFPGDVKPRALLELAAQDGNAKDVRRIAAERLARLDGIEKFEGLGTDADRERRHSARERQREAAAQMRAAVLGK
ncbi:hypothetical protein [Sutterella sp.]|uniref:hypothetical protein n=1 Tax=Sutterella sp. TaxID=1981025 RepID=UPI0026DEA646|nr:hypothetical protein [Sutterella sp.]MDO5531899.1 hypothetical protein [Sutterella sp.]